MRQQHHLTFLRRFDRSQIHPLIKVRFRDQWLFLKLWGFWTPKKLALLHVLSHWFNHTILSTIYRIKIRVMKWYLMIILSILVKKLKVGKLLASLIVHPNNGLLVQETWIYVSNWMIMRLRETKYSTNCTEVVRILGQARVTEQEI